MAKYNDKRRIVIECNQAAFDEILPLLKQLQTMGNQGSSRSIKIEDYDGNNSFGFDGDGPSTITKIIEKSNKESSMTLIIPIKDREKTEDVLMPTVILKAREHLGRAQGTGNAKGTVAPREPEGGSGEKPKGASKPEKSSVGTRDSEISQRGGHKDPYSSFDTSVSGEQSSASNNLILKNTDTGKIRKINISAGSKHKAKFNNTGNLVSVTIDGKKYPCANHLVSLPTGVYRYVGLRSTDQGSARVARNSGDNPGAK